MLALLNLERSLSQMRYTGQRYGSLAPEEPLRRELTSFRLQPLDG
ncbi:MAG TPA: hypothetical protein V6C90_18475 [Coleofasciculaceae cyanobacterium]